MIKENVLLFGGAFDPFHNGHVAMLDKAIGHLTIKRVLLIPNYRCPGKEIPTIPAIDRHQLLQQLIARLPQRKTDQIHYECIDYEVKQKNRIYNRYHCLS